MVKCPANIQMITIATRTISTARAQRKKLAEGILDHRGILVDRKEIVLLQAHRQSIDHDQKRPLQGEILLLRTEVLIARLEVNEL